MKYAMLLLDEVLQHFCWTGKIIRITIKYRCGEPIPKMVSVHIKYCWQKWMLSGRTTRRNQHRWYLSLLRKVRGSMLHELYLAWVPLCFLCGTESFMDCASHNFVNACYLIGTALIQDSSTAVTMAAIWHGLLVTGCGQLSHINSNKILDMARTQQGIVFQTTWNLWILFLGGINYILCMDMEHLAQPE